VDEAFSFYEKALGRKGTDPVQFYNGYNKEYAAYQRDKSLE
jgi:hypothetical protein